MSSMSEDTDPSESRAVARTATASQLPNRVTFNRLELNRILNLYGRMVAEGANPQSIIAGCGYGFPRYARAPE